ncbi:hypothetical protein FP2506_04215 [Fulvimarina pelagi HTCC2506]|uniref:Uncharacterized protein n=2 Tax=Fulvimarina pelagi TaxID=217511 RepID=Q0FZ75_9HYPH|nr:hypothetical protein [Fulvimarina pelagi]EAU40403.1 hypothetical protein FP2506_04215 [Fulvimarina pelagi HTCC2506]BAT31437.1 hypothetical protein [Fulvimarina pelagi]
MKPETRGVPIADIPKTCDALVVLDIDEVILEFIGPFDNLLAEHGARLHFDSYKLTGNARSLSTGAALSGGDLDGIMQRLYAEQETRQAPVAGSREALARLAAHADIVFLTAMEPRFYDERRRTLDEAGLTHPMIATERSKGGVVAELSERWQGPVVFVDDLAPNLQTVQRSVPRARLVQIMAHPGFRPHLPPLPKGVYSANDWWDAAGHIEAILRAPIAENLVRPQNANRAG